MTDSLKVKIEQSGAREAAAELKKYGDLLQAAGVTGEEFERRLRSQRDEFKRQAKELSDAESKLKSWKDSALDAAKAAGVVALGIAGLAVGAVKLGQTLAEGAAHAQAHQRALTTLGPAYAEVERATRGVISAEQALKVQQDLTQSGMRISAQDLATITRTAREFALRTGGDARQALEQLTEALRNGEAGGLRRFGLTVDGTGNRVRALHGALDQMNARFRGVAPSAQTMAESIEQSSRQYETLKNSLFSAASEVLHLQEVFQGLIGFFQRVSSEGVLVAVGEQIANVFDPSGQAESRARRAADERRAAITRQQNLASGQSGINARLAAFANAGVDSESIATLRRSMANRNYSERQTLDILNAFNSGRPSLAYQAIQNANQTAGLNEAPIDRRADERAESQRMMQQRLAAQAAGIMPSDPAVVREMGHELGNLVRQAQRAHFDVTQVEWRAGESLMSVIRRQTVEFERLLVNSHNRVYRHRGETDDAFLQRRIAVVQRELQVVEENERAKREAIDETTAAIKAQIEADERAKATAANDQEITRRQRRGAGFQLIRGLGQRATTSGLVQDAEGALGLRGFNPGGAARDTERGALLGRVQSLTEQAANTQDESTAEQLQAQAAAIAEVVGRYDELRRSQQAANDTGLQFAQAFSQHTELVSTSAQTMASVASEAFGTFKNALRQHIGAVLAGKENIGEALRAIAQATLSNLAERSLYEGLFETAKGIGKLAASYGADPTAYGHFAAAAGYFGLAALGGLGAYGLSQMAPQSGGGVSPSAYTDKPASATPAHNNSGNGTVVINNTFSGVVIGNSQENVDRWITDAVNRAHRRGDIRAA